MRKKSKLQRKVGEEERRVEMVEVDDFQEKDKEQQDHENLSDEDDHLMPFLLTTTHKQTNKKFKKKTKNKIIPQLCF